MPFTFLLIKSSYFFKFSFRETYFSDEFWQLQIFLIVNVWHSLPTYFFTKEHKLKTSNKRTYISLLINQFSL